MVYKASRKKGRKEGGKERGREGWREGGKEGRKRRKREHDLKDFQLSIFKGYSLGQRDLTEFIVKMFIWERGENEGGPIKQVKRTCF